MLFYLQSLLQNLQQQQQKQCPEISGYNVVNNLNIPLLVELLQQKQQQQQNEQPTAHSVGGIEDIAAVNAIEGLHLLLAALTFTKGNSDCPNECNFSESALLQPIQNRKQLQKESQIETLLKLHQQIRLLQNQHFSAAAATVATLKTSSLASTTASSHCSSSASPPIISNQPVFAQTHEEVMTLTTKPPAEVDTGNVGGGGRRREGDKATSVDSRSHKCELHSKAFRQKQILLHSSVKARSNFICPFCCKTCRLKGNLKKHLLVHVNTMEELEWLWKAEFSRALGRPKENMERE